MAIKSLRSYESAKYRSLPRDKGRKKDKEYCQAYASAVWHRYITGYNSELKYESSHLSILEKYAEGTQGARKVKEKMLRQQKDGTFKGFTKDVFQTFDILPELIDIMMANNMKADYRPSAIAIDKASLEDKDMELGMAKFLVQEQTKEFLGYMGLKIESVLTDEEIAVYNDSDIDVLFKTGGIQLQREMDAVASCNDAMVSSNHKEIENQNTYDLIRYAIAATKTYIDHSEDNVKYEYVDPKNLVIPRSKYNDFRDISYAGQWKFMRIHEIISQCPSIRPDQIRELIENRGAYNKDFGAVYSELDGYINGHNDVFDEYLVPVLDLQWLASDEEVYLQTPVSNGGFMYKEVKNNYKLDKKQNRNGSKLDRKKYIKRYTAVWVIGSDIMLEYGPEKDNTYYGPKGKRIPTLDYTIQKTGKKSLVDRARTIVDDINLNVAKHRSAIASLPPGPGLIIYEHALQNIKFGKKLQSPRDLIDGLVEGGVLVVNGRDSKGNYIASNGGKAVDQIPPFAMQQIAVFGAEIQNQVNRLRQVLGLPEGLDGTTGSPYTGVGQVQLAAMASSNALFPTLSQVGPLFTNTLEKCVLKWQLLSKKGVVELKNAKSSSQYKVLSLSKDFSNYDFKIKVVFAPTEEEKAFLIQQVNEMAQAYVQTNGNIGCSKAEFFMLYKLIKSNLLDEAMYQVARIEKLREQNTIRQQQAQIQANAQQNNQSIQLNNQAAMQQMAEKGRQDRLNESAKVADETIKDLTKSYLSSFDKESGAIPGSIYAGLVGQAQQERMAIEQEALPPQEPPVPEEQAMV